MSSWERARLGGEPCGRCGAVVAEQMPLRAIYLADGRLRKVRCPACAGEPVNDVELATAARARDWDLTMRHKARVPSRGPVPLSAIAKASVVMLGKFNPAIFQPSWFARQNLLTEQEADNLGASQSPTGETTVAGGGEQSGSETLRSYDLLKSGWLNEVVPPIVAVDTSRSSVLNPRQVWEGTVVSRGNEDFVCIVTDRTNPDNPEEEIVLDLGEVSQADLFLVQPGARFYWCIGSESTLAGQVKNVSIIKFRRLPRWTRSAIQRVAKRVANRLDGCPDDAENDTTAPR